MYEIELVEKEIVRQEFLELMYRLENIKRMMEKDVFGNDGSSSSVGRHDGGRNDVKKVVSRRKGIVLSEEDVRRIFKVKEEGSEEDRIKLVSIS